MPELPEVETVVRYVRPRLEGKTITAFHALWPRVTAPQRPEDFVKEVTGQVVRTVRRRGKFILFDLDRGHIHLHLRMTGRLTVCPTCDQGNVAHITALFDLDDGSRLVFNDTRKFGRVGYLDRLDVLEARLGPEPLSPEFTPEIFHQLLHGRRRQIKPLLLDQTFLAGLGNIYVDEALFLARIHPQALASDLDVPGTGRLHQAIQSVLRESIRNDGTTIINFGYGDEGRGRFREMLQVFRREGEPCPFCGTPIAKIRVAQRGTHLCPHCQSKGT